MNLRIVSVRPSNLLSLGLVLALPIAAQTVVPSNQLPTGGQVSAGQATISQNGSTLTVNQTSQRAVVDWQTFNVGSQAQVQFQQPNAQSATLNRVADNNPSQILGRITAPGQVVLVNPQGVYFGKTATVDVGGLVASTHNAANQAFMDGQMKFDRQGSTGKVVNEGDLRAALNGYIALLAPEVRNSGVIVANLGTVALAAGEAFELQFETGRGLTGLRVTPASINTLVDNQKAIRAPGGLIILSAQSVARLRSGVVNNGGLLEANGLSRKGGRIILEASTRVSNSGTVQANATPTQAGVVGGPAGSVSIQAPEVVNTGVVSAAVVVAPAANPVVIEEAPPVVAQIQIQAEQFSQTSTGVLDVSALGGPAGRVSVQASQTAQVSGQVLAVSLEATDPSIYRVQEAAVTPAVGGVIELVAEQQLQTSGAVLDASGVNGAGRVHLQSKRQPGWPTSPEQPAPSKLIIGNSVLRANSSRSLGGRVELESDELSLDSGTRIEAKGATGGGTVWVGGGWQGNGSMHQATSVYFSADSQIDASATENGDGGEVVLWSRVTNDQSVTAVYGNLLTLGAGNGQGGRIETSGAVLTVSGHVQAGNDGLWLLDPIDIYVGDSYGSVSSSALSNALNSSNVTLDATGASISCVGVACSSGTGNTGHIFIGGAVTSTSNKTLMLKAGKDIFINAPIVGTSGLSLDFQASAGSVQINQTVNVSGSLSVASSGKFVTAYDSSITANAGITKVAGGGQTSLGGNLTTTTGNIAINGDLLIRKDLVLTTTTGNVSVTGTIDSIATTAQTFTTSTAGTSSSTTWTAPTGVSDIEVLVVAGGGSGGWGLAGGGGAGGYIYNANYAVTPGTGYSLTVGAGGARVVTLGQPSNAGANSVFGSGLTAIGGGGGAGVLNYTIPSSAGGSGGGGSWYADAYNIGTPNNASSALGQGNSGGNYTSGTNGGGGGGGALTAGATGPNGAGGSGIGFAISGTSTTYAAGGGGAVSGAGGSSGVGGDGSFLGGASTAPNANTGSGSGGVNQHNPAAVTTPGADGVVVVRYKTTGNSSMTINTGGSQGILYGAVNLAAGSLTKQGTGSLSLLSSSTYSGGTTIVAGTLGYYADGAFGSGTLTGAGGTLKLGRSITTFSNNINLTGNMTAAFDNAVDFLVVGGGGGGGGDGGGGGGGGAIVSQTGIDIGSALSLTATVGGGGTLGAWATGANGGAGGNSSMSFGASTYTATGGSGGITGPSRAGGAGGSGNQSTSSGGTGGSGTSGRTGLSGANGPTSNITGILTNYGGGGGGAVTFTDSGVFTGGAGGAGGGGAGTSMANDAPSTWSVAGAANTGGGGGAGTASYLAPGVGDATGYRTPGAQGGSGLVVIRYLGSTVGSGGTISAGSGSALGYTLHTFTNTGSGTLMLNALSATFSGKISGSGSLTASPSAGGKFTFTGNNDYSGSTTLSSGTLQVGIGGAAGALGVSSAAVINNGTLIFNRSDSLSYSGLFSGTGALTVATGDLTLTGGATYTGLTTLSATATPSSITYTNNVPPSTSGFAGTGPVIIQPVANGSFTSALTPTYTLASSLTGLTLGGISNTSTVTLNNTVNISGPISVYGGSIVVNSALSAAGDIVLDAETGSFLTQNSKGVTISASVSTTTASNGNITIHGRGGSGSGYFGTNGVTITNLVEAGGSGNINITGYGGLAANGSSGSDHGITLEGASAWVKSNGGNVSLTGTAGGAGAGTYSQGIVLINSSKASAAGSGTLTLVGTGGVNTAIGLRGVVINTSSSIYTAGGAINITGITGSNGSDNSDGVSFDTTTIGSASTGAITITGTPGGGSGSEAISITGTTGITSSGSVTFSGNSAISAGVNTFSGDVTLSGTVSSVGAITVDGGQINLNGSLQSSAAGAGINLRAKTSISNTAVASLTTNGGNILLASNVDDATDGDTTTNGYIRLDHGLNATSNGGNITIGGGNTVGTGHALGSSSEDQTHGIRFDKTLNLNSAGGNIALRGKSYSRAVSSGYGASGVGFYFLTSSGVIDSGTGTVYIDGYSQTSGSAYGSGVYLFTQQPFTIKSANTTADAIKIIAKATGTSGDTWGIEQEDNVLSILATATGGGITLTTSQKLGYEAVFRSEVNVLAKSGPITWTTKADADGVGNGIWYNNVAYWGSKSGSLC